MSNGFTRPSARPSARPSCDRAWPWAFLGLGCFLGFFLHLGDGLNLRLGLLAAALGLGLFFGLGASLTSFFHLGSPATVSTFGSAFLRPRLALGFPRPWGLLWLPPSPRQPQRRLQPSARPSCDRAWPWAFPRPWVLPWLLPSPGDGLNLRLGLLAAALGLGLSSALGASFAASFTSPTSA